MSYRFQYVFLATPFECEQELDVFHSVLAKFNEMEAMPKGYLYTPLTLVPALTDKRPFQGAISENIRMCRYYLQVIEDSWGPPQRDFERDWALAQRAIADPELPMREAVLLFKAPLLPHKMDPAIIELKEKSLKSTPHAAFETPAELRKILASMFSRWLVELLEEATMETCLS